MTPLRLAGLVLACALAPGLALDSAAVRLVPKPRELVYIKRLSLKSGVAIDAPTNAADKFAAADLTDELKARGVQMIHSLLVARLATTIAQR